MRIKVKWTNKNLNEDGVRVYKSDSPIDPYDLPEPLTTLPGGSTYFNDGDIIRGNTYYYRVESFRGNDKSVSDQITVLAQPRTGVGSQDITMGDTEMGYYGAVNQNTLFYPDELKRLAGVNGGLNVTDTSYLKIAYRGKTYFLPYAPIANNVSWLDLYNRGVVYSEGTGEEHWNGNTVTTNLVQQGKIIKKNGETYKVRLLSGINPGQTSVSTITSNSFRQVTNSNESEWDNIVYRVFGNYEFYNFHDMIFRSAAISGIEGMSNNGGAWTSSIINASSAVARGGSHGASIAASPMHGVSLGVSYRDVRAYWWPILEYVPSDEVEADVT